MVVVNSIYLHTYLSVPIYTLVDKIIFINFEKQEKITSRKTCNCNTDTISATSTNFTVHFPALLFCDKQ